MNKLRIYRDQDGDLSIIQDKVIAFIGYGNQGRSQALNMRDQGLHVIIGNREDSYRQRAREDGFETFEISEAVRKSDMLFLLVPDEIQQSIYERYIRPFLKIQQTLVFAHGYNIAFNLIRPPPNIDVLIIAPRMIGIGVRECFLNKEGFFTFIGILQDFSSHARQNMLALAKGIGGLTKGSIETTFMQETVLDLFSEQGFAPASSQMMMKPINLLIKAGYPEELVFIEMILSGKLKYALQNMMNAGAINQLHFMSDRTQYGILSRGLRYKHVIDETVKIQREIVENIENGGFAKEWENKITKLKFRLIKFMSTRVGIGKLEKRVRKALKMPQIDIFAEIPYPDMEEIKKNQRLKQELSEFNLYSEF